MIEEHKKINDDLVHALIKDILGVEPMSTSQMKELFEIRDRAREKKDK
jgi:hypothetical protein